MDLHFKRPEVLRYDPSRGSGDRRSIHRWVKSTMKDCEQQPRDPTPPACTSAMFDRAVGQFYEAAGFVEKRTGKGSHVLFVHPESGKDHGVAELALLLERYAARCPAPNPRPRR